MGVEEVIVVVPAVIVVVPEVIVVLQEVIVVVHRGDLVAEAVNDALIPDIQHLVINDEIVIAINVFKNFITSIIRINN